MKKSIKYIIIVLFVVNGFILASTSARFGFDWWMGFINVSCWGGYLVIKLFNYLDK